MWAALVAALMLLAAVVAPSVVRPNKPRFVEIGTACVLDSRDMVEVCR